MTEEDYIDSLMEFSKTWKEFERACPKEEPAQWNLTRASTSIGYEKYKLKTLTLMIEQESEPSLLKKIFPNHYANKLEELKKQKLASEMYLKARGIEIPDDHLVEGEHKQNEIALPSNHLE